MPLIDDVGIEIALDAVLVDENVRPAMLVQPANSGERTHNDPITKNILKHIRRHFPHFIFSDDYEKYQGVIISKTKSYNDVRISINQMGSILGYPCYREFGHAGLDDVVTYSMYIVVRQKNGIEAELITNVCNDLSRKKEYEELARKAGTALKKKKYVKLLGDSVGDFELDRVYVKVDKIIPTQSLITNLIDGKPLDKDEMEKLINIFYNFSLDDDFETSFLDLYQQDNPVHRGVLLTMLAHERYDMLSPFFPLQQYPGIDTQVEEKTAQWGHEIIRILFHTRNKGAEKKKTAVRKRCPNGTRRNKKTGDCETK